MTSRQKRSKRQNVATTNRPKRGHVTSGVQHNCLDEITVKPIITSHVSHFSTIRRKIDTAPSKPKRSSTSVVTKSRLLGKPIPESTTPVIISKDSTPKHTTGKLAPDQYTDDTFFSSVLNSRMVEPRDPNASFPHVFRWAPLPPLKEGLKRDRELLENQLHNTKVFFNRLKSSINKNIEANDAKEREKRHREAEEARKQRNSKTGSSSTNGSSRRQFSSLVERSRSFPYSPLAGSHLAAPHSIKQGVQHSRIEAIRNRALTAPDSLRRFSSVPSYLHTPALTSPPRLTVTTMLKDLHQVGVFPHHTKRQPADWALRRRFTSAITVTARRYLHSASPYRVSMRRIHSSPGHPTVAKHQSMEYKLAHADGHRNGLTNRSFSSSVDRRIRQKFHNPNKSETTQDQSKQAAHDQPHKDSNESPSTKPEPPKLSYRQLLAHSKLEHLSDHHISKHTEGAPFRLHYHDILRSVSKWSFFKTNFLYPFNIERIRPVVFPYWYFQGKLVLTHRPSGTTKEIDFDNTYINDDVTAYCKALGVQEDELYHILAPEMLVNPNVEYGRVSDTPRLKDLQGDARKKAELDVCLSQSNTINTLRLRNASIFAGSEWATWMTESLKIHPSLVQEFHPNMLELPKDPIQRGFTSEAKTQTSSSSTQSASPKPSSGDAPLPGVDTPTPELESRHDYARNVRIKTNPLKQNYRDLRNLERAWKILAPELLAVPNTQKSQPLETDDAVRSEKSSLLAVLERIVLSEMNLVERGVGVLKRPLPHAEQQIPGAFLPEDQSQQVLTKLVAEQGNAKIEHDRQDDGNKDDENNEPIDDSHPRPYTQPLCPMRAKLHETLGSKNDLLFLQNELIKPNAKCTYTRENTEFVSQLRGKIKAGIQTARGRDIEFDIPNSDYSVAFKSTTSRKILAPGYINEYKYMGRKWRVISSAVTGVSAGIPQTHIKRLSVTAFKSVFGLSIGVATMKFAFRKLLLPPIVTAITSLLIYLYSLRDAISGHQTYAKNTIEWSRTKHEEAEFDKECYGDTTPSNGDMLNDSSRFWAFQPQPSFYSLNNLQSNLTWNTIMDNDAPMRSQQRTARQQAEQDKIKKQHEEERLLARSRPPPPIPSDPYILILGLDANNVSSLTQRQVQEYSLHDIKRAYREQLLKYHPDLYRDETAYWSVDYATERTSALIKAFNKINTEDKRQKYNKTYYR